MRVKVGNEWHDSDETPICLELSEGERDQIAAMNRETAPNLRYAIVPGSWDRDYARAWIRDQVEA